MLELLFIATLQAVAGDPAPQQPQQPQAQEQTESAQTAEDAARERRRCRTRQVTGTRLQSLITCRTREGVQDLDTRETLHDLQRPPPFEGS